MTKIRALLLFGLVSGGALLFWPKPAQHSTDHQKEIAETNTIAAQPAPPGLSAPHQAAPDDKHPVCQQVLPDQHWLKTPQRHAIRQYLFDRLQQGDSAEQLLQMLRDRPAADVALSRRQAELQYDLLEMLSRYLESQLQSVPTGQYADFFNHLRQKTSAEKIAWLRRAPELELLFREDDASGRLIPVQPKTFLLSLALDLGLFKQAIKDLRFHPRDYRDLIMGINQRITPTQLEQLLQQTDDLQDKTNLFNLADQAVYLLRPDLLPVLARYQILPSRKDGLFSAMDIAFSSTWRQQGWSQPQRRAQQRATIQYLQQLGYPLHAELKAAKNSRPYLQVHALHEPGYISYDEDLINLAKAQQLLPLQSLPAPEPLRVLLHEYQQLEQQQQKLKATCKAQQATEITAQGLWSGTQIIDELDALASRHNTGELPQRLHQLDPALLALYWRQQDNNVLIDNEVPINEADFVKTIQGNPDPDQAAALLSALVMRPEWTKYWPSGLAVSQLDQLMTHPGTERWQSLQQQGFDLGITDTKGRNLYPQAFADSAEAVSLLINAKVPLQQNPLGPDALDLALDASYLQQQLHPALFYILQETERLRPSHLARLKRLQQYRPALFQQLQAQFKLPELTSVTPNPMLSLEP